MSKKIKYEEYGNYGKFIGGRMSGKSVLDDDDELSPLEALKVLKYMNELNCWFEFDFEIIEKSLKALEIIKKKVMPLVDLDYEPERKGREYRVYDNELYQYTDLTQEEYDLLREVLL